MGLNVELLEQSFKLVAPKADALVNRFYERLFQKYPAVKPLFKDVSMADQKKKLLASLVLVIQNLRKPEKLTEPLQTMGARHVAYGALPAHYDAVGENLLAVLGEFAGPAWTPQVKQAWTEAYGAIKTIMLQGAARLHEGTSRPTGAPQRLSRTARQSSGHGFAPLAWFGNLKMMWKLMAGFALMGAIMCALGIAATQGLSSVRENLRIVYEDYTVAAVDLAQVSTNLMRYRNNVIQATGAQDQETYAKFTNQQPALKETILKALEAYAAANHRVSTSGRDEAKDLQTFRDALAAYFPAAELSLSFAGDVWKAQSKQEADAIREKSKANVTQNAGPKLILSMNALDQLLVTVSAVAKDMNEAGKTAAANALLALSVGTAAAIAFGLLLGWLIARFLARNLADVITAAQSLGGGDLTARSSVTTKDEVGILALAFNEMGQSLEQASAKQEALVATMNNAEANLLMCDKNLCITSVNEGAMKTFRSIETEIRKVLPTFDSSKLVGTCIDGFHRDPQRIRRILGDPRNLPHRADIKLGLFTLDLNVKAILNSKGEYVGNSLEWLNVTETRKLEVETARLQAGLDNTNVNVMICDRNYQVVYMNKMSLATLQQAESLIQQALPGFRADKVIGSCIDQYHKNPAAIRTILDNPKNLPRKAEIKLGKLTLDLSASAILNAKGEYLGNVVEWADVTAQKNALSEVDQLITAASAGQLANRIDASKFEGGYRSLSEGINRLLDAVVRPLHEAQTVLTALSQGDLRTQMTGSYEGEFDQMKASLNMAITNLTSTLATVRTAAESVSTGAEQITKGNEDLSHRTAEQASSLEETSSAMEEMTSTVKQNADNAKQANQLAIAARDVAEQGGSVTTKAIDAMEEINKSSKKIADIITVIDEIAFQTNLLALNAAVEAARAGEHGRGFAVVAAEVRNLAQRSASAAKEIKGLINESVQRVTDGSELVDQSGKTLTEIVGSVKRVTDIIAEISAASQEQASGIDQVNKAIMQMDETTQQNAALVEEATSASQSMKEQARELMDQVASFKLTQSGQGQSQRSGGVAQKPGDPSVRSVKKPLPKKPASAPESAAVASGNGKESEFEEF